VFNMPKKAPFQASDDLLTQGRNVAYNREDRDLYLDVGMFVTRFSHVELALTHLLAFLTGSHDLEAFDILCRGMDARVKAERLRKAAKRGKGLGPNFSARLKRFEEHAIQVRNLIVHSAITHSEGDGPITYYLSGIASLPWKELDMGKPLTTRSPEHLRSLDLYAWSVWLSFFAEDLSQVRRCALAQETLEIAIPKSRLSQEDY